MHLTIFAVAAASVIARFDGGRVLAEPFHCTRYSTLHPGGCVAMTGPGLAAAIRARAA